MDPYLVAMVRAAQSGEPCPPVWMTLNSGDLVTGTPTRSDRFVEETAGALASRYQSRGLKRRSSEETVGRSVAEVAPMRAVNPDASEPTTITLADARIRWGGRGDGADLPVVRVALDAVALWWLAGGKEIKSSSTSFFVGATGIGN
jgi:hypothetical protein